MAGRDDIMKIIITVATRCYILKIKCIKFDFGWVPLQTPLEDLTVLPQTSWLDLRGPTCTSKGKEGEERGKRQDG